jgi:hypothetical protein
MSTTSKFRDVIVRALVPAQDMRDVLDLLEPCGHAIWLSRTTKCSRHNLIGVPAKRIDVLVQDGIGTSDGLVCCEVVRKTGKYDGAVRTRLTLRRHHTGYDVVEARLEIDMAERCTVRIVRDGDTFWSESFDRLRATASPHGIRDLVMWHWSRYFQHLDVSTAERVAAELVIAEGTTITMANRQASNRLYEESVALGWKKLTARERDRLGYPTDAGAWQREESVARMRAIRAGIVSPTGCGEYTLQKARG